MTKPRPCAQSGCRNSILGIFGRPKPTGTLCISCVNKRMAKCKTEKELRDLLSREG